MMYRILVKYPFAKKFKPLPQHPELGHNSDGYFELSAVASILAELAATHSDCIYRVEPESERKGQ